MLDTHKMLRFGHSSMRHSGTASFLRQSMFQINPSDPILLPLCFTLCLPGLMGSLCALRMNLTTDAGQRKRCPMHIHWVSSLETSICGDFPVVLFIINYFQC